MPLVTSNVNIIAGETLKLIGPAHVEITTSVTSKVAAAKTTGAASVAQAGTQALAANKTAAISAAKAAAAKSTSASLIGSLGVGSLGTSTAISAAAPIIGVGALAYGSYWLYKEKIKGSSKLKIENIWPF